MSTPNQKLECHLLSVCIWLRSGSPLILSLLIKLVAMAGLLWLSWYGTINGRLEAGETKFYVLYVGMSIFIIVLQTYAASRSITQHHAAPRSAMHYHAASRNIPSTITINIPHLFSPSTIDVQQVVDFSIAYDEKNNAVYGLLYIFQGGTTYVTSLILLASFIIH